MKFEKEITVEVSCSFNELISLLEKNNFKIIEEYDLKDIYILKNDYVIDDNYLDMLNNCVLIRHVIGRR